MYLELDTRQIFIVTCDQLHLSKEYCYCYITNKHYLNLTLTIQELYDQHLYNSKIGFVSSIHNY